MNSMSVIDDKIKAFTPAECIRYARKERKEGRRALKRLLYAIETGASEEVIGGLVRACYEEFADEHITGLLTFEKLFPDQVKAFDDKHDHVLHYHLPEVIRQKRCRDYIKAGRHLADGVKAL